MSKRRQRSCRSDPRSITSSLRERARIRPLMNHSPGLAERRAERSPSFDGLPIRDQGEGFSDIGHTLALLNAKRGPFFVTGPARTEPSRHRWLPRKAGPASIRKSRSGIVTNNQAADIRWVANEVADLAVLLRSHGLGHLARTLTSVQQALQYVPLTQPPPLERAGRIGNVVSLERFRKHVQLKL